MSPLLAPLNEPQREAVLKTEGPLLILAGAGSGKTRVITHRIAYLVLEKGVSPFRICALTFTNKAAAEMRERVQKLIPNSAKQVIVKTFHSLCLYILRLNANEAGLESGFTVYDSSLQESLIKGILKDLRLDSKDYKPAHIASIINQCKDRMISVRNMIEDSTDKRSKEIAKVFEEYEKRMKSQNAADYGDLILKVVLIFKNHPHILKKYNMLWEYILIDEYQDTNKIQYELTRMLGGESQNLCVVGDDDQSIYSWRGADIRNILEFEKDFKNVHVVKLEENYRSTANIIDAASNLISNNESRKDKKIFTRSEAGDKIRLFEYYNDYEEAQSTIRLIKQLYKEEKEYLKFAIFYRTNAQSRYFEEALRNENIAYKIYGGFRFYDRAEIKDMIAYLSVIVNPNDSSSLLRIINSPARGIGDATIEKLRTFSLDKNISLFDAMNIEHPEIRKATAKKLKELHSSFSDLIDMHNKKELPSRIASSVFERMGIAESFHLQEGPEGQDRYENAEQFIRSMEEYESQMEEPKLDEFLGTISLLTSEEDGNEVSDYVTLMTIHNSKGLEFDYVFLAGLEEGTFPHYRSIDEPSGMEEERRLCYVAITRARKKLFISYSKIMKRYGSVEDKMPSRFLDEIPEKLIERSKNNGMEFGRKPNSFPYSANLQKKEEEFNSKKSSRSAGEFQIGMKVRHRDFGNGIIVEINGTGDNCKAKIAFGTVQKNFFLAYTPLEKIN